MYLRFVLVRLMCCSYINCTHSAKSRRKALPGFQEIRGLCLQVKTYVEIVGFLNIRGPRSFLGGV